MTDSELIPLEILLGNPERANAQISPDGKKLSYVAPLDGVLNVFVGDAGAGNERPVTFDTRRGIQDYFWAHDHRHIMYIRDKDGSENYRVYDVDLETGEERDLTPMDDVQCRIIAHRKEFPNDVLIGINKDYPQLHDIYHLDLTTGELKKVVENPGCTGWVVDAELKVRCALAPTEDGGATVLVRDTEKSEWRPLVVVSPDEVNTTGPVGFTMDGNSLYLNSSLDSNTSRFVKVDIATGAVKVIAADPTYDVGDVMIQQDTREPQMVTFYKDRPEQLILDESILADVETLKQLNDGDMFILDRDHADRTWLIAFDADAGPVKFYTYDRDTTTSTFLFDHRPELNDYTLAAMEPFSFTARDGLEIHGYLSYPPGVDRKKLPTVLNVHGGPWARDYWGLHPEAQWLANRGYLCVQVNYRGSTGYGKDFINAGNREWGARMHDDLIDALEHLIALGHADRDRLAIYGCSYGGYAALVGATFTPDVFRCAISMVGPSNLNTLLQSLPEYWKPTIAMWHHRLGNNETEPDFLWSRSPLSKVENIRVPVLVAQGANDPRVKQAESEQIVAAMKERGIDHEYLLFDGEGHGFVKPENRLAFYYAVDKFLAKHLGGRAE